MTSATASKSVEGYNRLASVYKILERLMFGGMLQQTRVALLDQLPSAKRVLILGDGDGRLLEQLAVLQPDCTFTSVDQSERMLEMQRQRMQASLVECQIDYVCADARDWHRQGDKYDILVTPFFLDCFTVLDLSVHIPSWLDNVLSGGHFLFVDFVQPKSGWRSVQSAGYQSLMHWFFRWQTALPNRRLVDLEPVLKEQDLELISEAASIHPMTTSRIYRVR